MPVAITSKRVTRIFQLSKNMLSMIPYYIPRTADLSEVHYLVQKDQTAKPIIYRKLTRQVWIRTIDIPEFEGFLKSNEIPFK